MRLKHISAGHWCALAGLALWLALSCAVEHEQATAVQRWWDERGPVVPHDTFPADCSLCHEGDGWRKIRADVAFDHEKETGVALEGAHENAECLRCHNDRGPAAMFAARGCAGCHQDPHRGQLGQDCSVCHQQDSWRPNEVLALHSRTRFPLVGAHAAAACWRCHPGAQVGNFARVDTECLACHRSDLARATNPDHAAQGWTVDCERCHVPTAWSGGAFNHSAWPLTGEHASLACDRCHAGGIYAGTPTQCVDCHLDDYQSTNEPNHALLGLPTSCEQCHTTRSWQVTSFSHAGITSGCVQCHLSDYQATSQPDHAPAGFGTTCEQCHTSTRTWHSTNWDHSPFPIDRGAHRNFDCTDCHISPGNYSSFSCTHCHAHGQSEMDRKHDEVSNYVWQSSACYNCHPDGRGDD